MKHVVAYTLLVLFALSIEHVYGQNLKRCQPYAVSLTEASMSIDPRIEFFQIFIMMAGNPNISSVETSYKTAIIDYFGRFKDHPSLIYYRRNFPKFFTSIDAPYPFLLSLKSDFAFRTGLVHNDWQTHREIDTLLNAFQEFARDTDFSKFFNSQKNYYELLLANTSYLLDDFDERKRMLDYYGIDRAADHTFHIILNTLGMGNFAGEVTTRKSQEHYAIVSTGISANELPVYRKRELEHLVWHEFGHSFTNPLVDKYWNEFEKTVNLFKPIRESMQSQAYQSWKTTVYEHMTRAVGCRLAALKYGEVYSDINYKRLEIGRRFIYCYPIIQALRDYENFRDTYPTLDSFMPIIINSLISVADNDIKQWMDMVVRIRQPDVEDIPESSDFFASQNQLIIVSSNEDDLEADLRLKNYLAESFPNIPTMEDTSALKADLSDYDLLVIGTPWGNRFMEKYIADIPIRIGQEQLITNKIYKGTGYAFMTGWPHPDDTNKVMTLYLSQNPEDLINFAWVRRGGTDYHIMKDLITLKAGDYKKRMKIWECD